MLSQTAIWIIFGLGVCLSLFLDLFVFHKKAEEPSFKHSLKDVLFYLVLAVLFGVFLTYERGTEAGALFLTGFLVELSLSFDNIFVMALVFAGLHIPKKYHHRVLFFGILGAVVFRAIMIFLGVQIIERFHFVLYIFSVFLIFTGVKMIFSKSHEEGKITDSRLYRFLSRKLRMVRTLNGEHFVIRRKGMLFATPLLMALIIIEFMDIVFAVDSIPAIFLITQDALIVYTSNIFAILGLRAKYFLLSSATTSFPYLKNAISVILIFVGFKIFSPIFGVHITPTVSLIVTGILLSIGIFGSVIKKRVSEK